MDEPATTITATCRAVAWASVATDVTALVGRVAGDEARRAVETVVATAGGLWKRASRLAAEVLGSVIEKTTRFLAADGFERMVGAIREKVAGWWEDVPTGPVATKALGAVLQQAAVRDACEEHLRGQAPERVAAAAETAERLAAFAQDAVGWVRRGNKALDWAGAVQPFVRLTGAVTLVALVGVALVTYTAWVAHDHLDSPTLAGQISDRVRAVLQTVSAVSAG